MDLVTFLGVLLRRWGVVVTGLILTLIVTIAVGRSLSPVYEAKGSVLLLGPSTDTSSQLPAPVNPYLTINDSVRATGVIIEERMNSEEIVLQLTDLGAIASYEVGTTEKTPLLVVTARGPSKEQVLYTTQLVLQQIEDELILRQQAAGAPDYTLIRSQLLSPPRASIRAGSKLRVMAAVSTLGLGTTLALVLVVEMLAVWRRRRRLEIPLTAADHADSPSAVSSVHATQVGPPPAEARGNGWQTTPLAPSVEVLVPVAPRARVEHRSEGATRDEVPADKRDLAQRDRPDEAPADDGGLEQSDGLVSAWWSNWVRQHAGGQAAQNQRLEQVEPSPDQPGEERQV